MKLTRIVVTNYRGVAARDVEVPPNGAIVSGKNASGKTSLLKAIRAALAGNDIGPDAIRNGADRAEILVNLDDVTVRRVITQKASTVTVTREGFKAAKPQTFLTELLGTSPLDPLDLFLADKPKRRAQILAALPVVVTTEQLRQWVSDLPANYDCSGHGLEVVGRLRAEKYSQRTAANAAAKAARDTADRIDTEAKAMAAKVPSTGAPTLSAATEQLEQAEAGVHDLDAQVQAAARSVERTAKARARIAELREKAEKARPTGERPSEQSREAACAAYEKVQQEIVEAQRVLEEARGRLAKAHAEIDRVDIARQQFDEAVDRADGFAAQADELAATLAETVVEAPPAEALTEARVRQEAAAAALELARQADAAEKRLLEAGVAKDAAKAAEDVAAHLDKVVRALTNEAPALLLAESKGIPGLSIEGDEIALDGVRLDALSGAEQMKLAVEIARRANARSKILVVDGLERLDPEQLDAFVRHATADGYQLLASRVAKGEIVIEAIEADAEAAQ